MARILVHSTRGTGDPTVAALALLVARTAVAEGHEVSVFLAGDAVMLMRTEVRTEVVGLGTGPADEHMAALVDAGVRIWVSGKSAAARGLAEEELAFAGAAFAMPDVLIRESLAHDRTFTY